MTDKEPRAHGILFGRGDELDADVEEPPMAHGTSTLRMPGYTAAPIPFGAPPEEDIQLTGEIPWELRDDPPGEPALR